MGTRKNNEARKNVKIETGTVTIKPDTTEKLLGFQIHETLKFQEHCRDNRKSIFNKLIPRMNALKQLSRNASFKTRLMVANATVMSIFCYMISVWGGQRLSLFQQLRSSKTEQHELSQKEVGSQVRRHF